MAYRLALSNRVCVRVEGKLPGAERGKDTRFNFTLDMERIDQDQVNESQHSPQTVTDFLVSKTSGWDGQQLVLDDDGNPASYSEEAFRELLTVPGMGVWIYAAYIRDMGVTTV